MGQTTQTVYALPPAGGSDQVTEQALTNARAVAAYRKSGFHVTRELDAYRIELLERVYECFMYKFFAQGIDNLEVPKEPLKVVLFKDFTEYTAFGKRVGDDIRFTAGFYEHTMNTAFFFDQGTHDSFKQIVKLDKELAEEKKEAIRRKSPLAGTLARPGTTVLLAPACSSLDMFADYAARGATFRRAVLAWAGAVRA